MEYVSHPRDFMPRQRLAGALLVLAVSLLPACRQPAAGATDYKNGVAAFKIKDYVKAREYWANAVAANDVNAYNNFGYLLYYGLGGAPDRPRAIELWSGAAKRGQRESQWHLGVIFEDGKAVQRDLVEAYAWYRCAAEGGAIKKGPHDIDTEIARDASQSVTKLLPALSPQQFAAAEKPAQSYIAQYARRPPR